MSTITIVGDNGESVVYLDGEEIIDNDEAWHYVNEADAMDSEWRIIPGIYTIA